MNAPTPAPLSCDAPTYEKACDDLLAAIQVRRTHGGSNFTIYEMADRAERARRERR